MTTKTDEQMRAELLPCPFCGGAAKLTIGFPPFKASFVDCQTCDASGRIYEEPAEAIAHWNSRATLQSQDREDAALAEILREAAAIIEAIHPEFPPRNMRRPIVDELEGFALMLDHARRIEDKP